MKKFVLSIISALFLGLIAVCIGTIVWGAGVKALGDPNLNAIYYLIYYTDFLVAFCAGIIIAKIDQLRDDLHKK